MEKESVKLLTSHFQLYVASMRNNLRQAECKELVQNYYLDDDILEELGTRFQIDFSKRYQKLGETKKNRENPPGPLSR